MRLRLAALGCLLAVPAAGRVLEVGPGRTYPTPSAAAAAARDGDEVAIAPGEYFDCAVWQASRLTIAASGGDVVLTDRACEGKAAFVVRGNGVVLRGLTFTRIRAPDGNGAGVRAEGSDLTIEGSRFVNDQDGILDAGGGFLRVVGCRFTDGGARDGPATHAVLASGLELLRIEGSVFEAARGGDHIAATARRIELDGNRLADPGGQIAGPLVTISGDVVELSGNTVEPGAGDRPGAVLVTGAASILAVRGNTLIEPAGSVPLLRNWTGLDATTAGNDVPAGIAAVSDAGSTWHRLRAWAADLRAQAHAAAGAARHQVAVLARDLRLIR
jgi:hypothetical protein